jgi:ParB family chromosome partitioning protein
MSDEVKDVAPQSVEGVSALQEVPLAKIRENPVALRQVNRGTESYLELVDSIKQEGVLNPIVVRPMVDPETDEEFFGLIDGLHRYTAAQDAGLDTIPAHIKSMEDAQVLVAQIEMVSLAA